MTMDFYTLKSVIRCLSFNIATVTKPNSMNEDWNNDSNEEIIMTLCSRNISITSVCDNYQIGYQSENVEFASTIGYICQHFSNKMIG